MKRISLIFALLSVYSASAQLALEKFNSPGLPAGWTMFNDTNKPYPGFDTGSNNFAANAYVKWQRTLSGDSMMAAISTFDPVGVADRWLITPSFMVTSADMFITWEDCQIRSQHGGSDVLEIWVSKTGGAKRTNFTRIAKAVPYPGVSFFGKNRVSIVAYKGLNIKVAFKNAGKDQGHFAIDNIQSEIIAPFADLALRSITPIPGSLRVYAAVGTPVTISGTVKNIGTNKVTSYDVNYRIGTGPVVKETKTPTKAILGFDSGTFSFTTPVIATAAIQPVTVWVTLTGDTTQANDTLITWVSGYYMENKPNKKMLAEEGTGTWCGWCPRGLIYMDSAYHKYPNNLSIVAVHGFDTMTITNYNEFMVSKITSYPSLLLDRIAPTGFLETKLHIDPAEFFNYYPTLKDNFALADIVIDKATILGASLTIKAKITPAANVIGDYRLALVLTEDRVSGTTDDYGQGNAYSGDTTSGMKNAEFDFMTLPYLVPATIMKYDFVARGIYPNPSGAVGSLPATMTSGTPYFYTFPAVTLNASWKIDKMKAIVLLINNLDGTVMNTQNIQLKTPPTSTSVSENIVGINGVELYPNPTASVVTIQFNLVKAQANLSIEMIDMLGKVVKTISKTSLEDGTYEIPTSVEDLPSGLYLVKISTNSGTVTERLSIVK